MLSNAVNAVEACVRDVRARSPSPSARTPRGDGGGGGDRPTRAMATESAQAGAAGAPRSPELDETAFVQIMEASSRAGHTSEEAGTAQRRPLANHQATAANQVGGAETHQLRPWSSEKKAPPIAAV